MNQIRAISKSTFIDVLNTTSNGYGGEARATIERIITNSCHAIGDGDGGEAGATSESIISNKNYITRYSIIINGGWDDNVT